MSQLNYPSGYSLLTQRLQAFGTFRKRWAQLHALAWFIILSPGSLLALFAIDGLITLPWFVLLPLFAVVIGLSIYAAVRFVIKPAMGQVTVEQEALVIEGLHGKLDNQIIGSLQLGQEVAKASAGGESLGYSMGLVSTLITRTADNIGALDLPSLVDRKRAKRDLQMASVVVVLFVGLAIAKPAFIGQRIDHLRDAYAAFLDMLFPVEMKVTPGDVMRVRGKPVTLGVEVVGSRRPLVVLHRTDLKTRKPTTDQLTLSSDHAEFKIEATQESFSYQFEYGGRRTAEYKVLVGDLPAIAAMNTELAYPAYTGMPARTLVGRLPKLQALAGTGVLVSIASTVDLHPELSYVTWQDGSRQPLTITGRFAHFSFNVDRPERATVFLTGSLGKDFAMPEPVSFEIAVQRDAPPSVDVMLRNRKLTMLGEEATHFGVNVLAEDDFGVAEVLLDYKIDTIDPLLNRPVRQGSLARLVEPARDRVKMSFPEIFKTLTPALEPGDRITITVSAKDNNTETGPSLGRAAPIEIVVVRRDLGAYMEQEFRFGSDPMMGGLRKVQRATNLLIEAEKTALTEAKFQVDKQEVKSRVGAEGWPGGSEDAVGDYFRLLSGEK